MRLSLRRLLVSCVVPAVGFAAATCTESNVTPTPAASPHRAAVSFAPVFSASATRAATVYQDAGLTIDSVRVVIVRPPADTLKDTTVALGPTQASLVLDLDVAALPGEQLQGGLQYRAGNVVLFAGQGTVVARAVNDPTPAAPSAIAVVPVGPGATAVSVSVTPASGSFPTTAPVTFAASALAAGGTPIAGALFAWSIDDATVATIDAGTGVVQPTSKGGAVHVRATTLNGTFGEAAVSFFAPPARIVTVSGSGQTGAVGSALPLPVVVQVQAATGAPVPSQTVVFGTSNGATVSPASALSDLTGSAQTTVTLGTTPGTYTIAAGTGAFNTTATATAVAGPAAAIVAVSGSGQTAAVQHAVSAPLVVKVTDRFGNAKGGAVVTWTRTSGTGSVSAAATTTDTSGQTSIGYTLGTVVGGESVSATVSGVATAATFGLTAIAGTPATVAPVAGGGQFGAAGSTLGTALVVLVTDGAGNPVSNVPVAWAVVSGAATLQSTQGTTGVDGKASATVALGSALGPSVITATASGPTGPATATFTVTAVTGTASQLTLTSGGGQTAAAGATLPVPIAVKVSDARGNGVANDNVAFAVATGGGSVVVTNGTTDGQGLAHATWTLGASVGPQTLTATRAGLTGSPLTISATATGGTQQLPAVGLAFLVSPSGGTAGAVLTPAVTVRAVDAQGGTVASFSGTIAVALVNNPGEASLGGTRTQVAVGGVATFSDLTVSAVATGYTLSAASQGLTSATSPPFNITTPSPTDTWTGTVSTDWNTAGNWSAGVPTGASNVTIPTETPHNPALSGGVSINDLTVQPGATLSLSSFVLTASGNVTGIGISGAGSVSMSGVGKTVQATLSNLSIASGATVTTSGTTSASGTINVSGTLTISAGSTVSANGISVSNGQLTVAGGTTTVSAISIAGSTGLFSQTGGTLTIFSGATFAGASTAGLITGGQLIVAGNFVQNGASSSQSFDATGAHRTTFNGALGQTVTIGTPGPSHFQDLEFSGTGNVTLGSTLSATGQLISTTGNYTVHGNGTFALGVTGLNVSALTLDNTSLVSTDGTITRFDNVTFENEAPTATPLTLTHPGAASPFVFNNTQFLVTPTTGKFVSATDDAPTDGHVFTIDFLGSTPVNGSSATATANGAVVNWGVTGSVEAWTNASGGSWSAPTNWSLGRVPTAGDSVVIGLPGTYTVTLDTTYTATYITLGGGAGTQTLSISGRPLTINNALTVLGGGAFTAFNVTLAGTGVMTNAGVVTLRNVTSALPLTNQATTVVAEGASLTGALTTTNTSLIRIQSDGNTSNDVLTVTNGFTNNGAIELSSTVGAFNAVLSVTNGSLTNAASGTITTFAGTGGARTLDVALNNQGSIVLNQPLTLTHASGTNTNSGTINATLADFTISVGTSFTNTGTLTIGTGHTLTVNNGTFTEQSGGTLDGSGALVFNNVATTLATGIGATALTVNAGTMTFGVAMSTAATVMTFANATINGSPITNAAGQTLTIRGAVINSTSLANNGTLLVNNTSSISGSLTTSTGSSIIVQSDGSTSNDVFTVASGFTNNGTIQLSSTVGAFISQLTVTSGTLTNASTGTITALAGTGGGRTIDAELNNQGAVTLSQPLTLVHTNATDVNSGTINATNGDLTLTQSPSGSFTNSGTVTIGTGHSWLINSGALTEQASATLGGGSLALSGVTATVSGPLTVSALSLSTAATLNLATGVNISTASTALTVDNSTVNGPGTITNAAGVTTTFRAATITSTSGVTNNGTLLVSNSSTIAGPLSTATGSTITIQSDGSTSNDVLTVVNGFTNNGVIQLSSTIGAFNAQLSVTNGTLLNAASGSIASQVGTGGGRTIDAQLQNFGIVTIDQPLTISHASATDTNNGTISLNGGDLTITESGTSPSFSVIARGVLTVGTGRTLTVNNGAFSVAASSTLDGNGALVFNSVTTTLSTGFGATALTVNGGTMNFGVPTSTASTATTFTNATVNGPQLTNATGQTLTLRGSTINSTPLVNNGTLLVNNTSALTGALTTSASSSIIIQSDGSTSNDVFTVANGFTNNGAIQLSSTIGSYNAQLTVTSGTLTNASTGTITALAGTGGARTIDAELNNQGAVTLSQPLTLVHTNATDVNSGTINAASGDLTVTQNGLSGTFTNSGTVTIGTGHTWLINGGALTEQPSATLGGAGALALSGLTATVSGPLTVSALSLSAATTLNLATGVNISTASTTLSVNNATINGPGAVINAAGVTTTFSNATVTSTSGVTNNGTLLVSNNSTIAGSLSTATGSTITIQSDGSTSNDVLTVVNGFTNNGAIQLSSTVGAFNAQLSVTNGTLLNAASGTIASQVGTGGGRTLDAQLQNSGAVTIDQPLTISHASAADTDNGTISLNGGDLTITESGTSPSFSIVSPGVLTVSAGRTLTVNNGTFTQQSGATIQGPGALVFNSAAATLSATISATALTVNGGSMSFGVAMSTATTVMTFTNATVNGLPITNVAGQTLTIRGSTINSTSLANNGTLLVNNTSLLTGSLTTGIGSSIIVQSDGSTSNDVFTVAHGFTNNGAIQLSSTVGGFNSQLVVPLGTLTNSDVGTISSLVGTGGARTLTAPLNNVGLVTINQTLTMNATSAQHSNGGTINLAGGDLILTQADTSPSFNNSGTLNVPGGRTLTVSGGSFVNGSTFSGGGALVTSNTANTFNAGFSLSGASFTGGLVTLQVPLSTSGLALTLINTTVTGSGTVTNVVGQTLTMKGSTVVTGALVNQGTLLSNGSSTLSGPQTTLANGSNVVIESDGSTSSAVLTFTGSVTNHGSVQLSSTVGAFNATLATTGGTFTNASDGTITTLAGTGGARAVSGTTSNQGTITILSGAVGTLTMAGSVTNTGTINMELASPSSYDVLAVTGALTLAGELNVTALGGYTPTSGTAFPLITYGSASGDFGTYTLPDGPGFWNHTVGSTALTLTRTSGP